MIRIVIFIFFNFMRTNFDEFYDNEKIFQLSLHGLILNSNTHVNVI